jgi:predicted PurR-regulated permease PerM
MPPIAIILLSKSHEHLVPTALTVTGSSSLITQISGFLVAFFAAAVIVVAIEALHKR